MLCLRLLCKTMQVALTVIVIVLFAWISPVYSQSRKAFTINEISELIKSGVNPDRVARFVEQYGVAFELDERTLQRLKQDGASEAVLSAVKKMSAQYTEERQLKLKEQEEATKRQRQEEATRKEQERIRVDEEKRRQAELARKKQEEAQQRAEGARQRQQEEVRRKEEETRKAEEQRRQQAEAEKARQAEEQRRQEEERLAEEKRRVEEEARRAEAERKKQEEAEARSTRIKIEEEQRRAKAQSEMLEIMKRGQTAAPAYKDGDFWHYNVIEDYFSYDSRALKGIYELRYSATGFQVFREKERVTREEGQVGVLLAMVGLGNYMGGQYLQFPLSIGQKWSHEYQSGVRASRTIHSWKAETSVKNVESITTPAGTLWAFRIVREALSHRGGKATFTYFYSPHTKGIVKMLTEFPNDRRTVEMVTFGSPQ
jgi:chemotaxis protein histidine kinase CheA